MATVSKWTPFGVALNLTATAGTVTRTSTTQYTVKINVSWETYYSGAKTNYGMTASSGGSSATINTFGTKASSGSGTFTGTYSISGNSSATKTITVTFKNFNSDNGQSATKTVSFNVTVPAWPSYTITYNDNGGSGGPGKQTKWKNQALTISSVKPTRTGYTFQGWATSSSATTATYSAGGTYPASSNANATLYAVWKIITYTIKYNANGGSSTPSNQTKNYGATVTLAGAITRTNYTFKGWATSATATSAAYAAGASYTKNASVTLYAVWELSYTKPRITGCEIERCNVGGMATESGTYAMVSFSWETDKDGVTVTIRWKENSESSYTSANTLTYSEGDATAGVYKNFVFGGANLSTDHMYDVQLTVADSVDSTTVTTTLASENFLIDFLNDGTGIAIGKAAEMKDTLDVNWDCKVRNHVYVGNKTGYLDGKTGCFISGDGYLQIQRSTANGYYPYIAFLLDDSTTVGAQIYYNPSNTSLTFTSASAYRFGNGVMSDKHLAMGYAGYTTETGVNTYWADNSTHWAVSRLNDGLTCTLGWVGSSSYASVTRIRARTVQYQNSSGTTALSDERMKTDFQHLDKWEGFFNQLEPVAFKMKTGSSGRYHIGFKAQQVEEALINNGLNGKDFAGFVKMKRVIDEDDPEGNAAYEEAGIKEGDDEYGLIYSEFIALNTYKIQKMQERIDSLEAIILQMQAEIQSLKGETTNE